MIGYKFVIYISSEIQTTDKSKKHQGCANNAWTKKQPSQLPCFISGLKYPEITHTLRGKVSWSCKMQFLDPLLWVIRKTTGYHDEKLFPPVLGRMIFSNMNKKNLLTSHFESQGWTQHHSFTYNVIVFWTFLNLPRWLLLCTHTWNCCCPLVWKPKVFKVEGLGWNVIVKL